MCEIYSRHDGTGTGTRSECDVFTRDILLYKTRTNSNVCSTVYKVCVTLCLGSHPASV